MPRLRQRSSKMIWPLKQMVEVFSGLRRRRPQKLRVAKIASQQKNSRLQRRLRIHARRNHAFFALLQRRQNRPSHLKQQLRTRYSHQLWQRGLVATVIGLVVGGGIWINLFVTEQVTLGGVPYRIVNKFWQDKEARTAYFAGDSRVLHGRLQDLGVEADIKDYYRDRFPNEYELDQYIHQIMFDRTGYVGAAYQVNNYGRLISIEY